MNITANSQQLRMTMMMLVLMKFMSEIECECFMVKWIQFCSLAHIYLLVRDDDSGTQGFQIKDYSILEETLII